MLRNESTAIEINNQTIKFSGRTIIVINLSQIVELVKGRLHPVNRGWYLMCALISALALSGLGVVVSNRVDAAAIRDLNETFVTVARYAGAGIFVLFVIRLLIWAFRRRTYGLMFGTAAGGWYTISSRSDESITLILESIFTRIESQQPVPSVTFNVERLDVSSRPANNVNTHFVDAGRDAVAGSVTQEAQ